MKARDVMVSPVITAKPSNSAKELAQIFTRHRISAVPVVDDAGKLVGIVSEGDLMRRADLGTEKRHSWWLSAFINTDTLATEYVAARARKVADLMTRPVITASPDTPLDAIATLLESNAIKRVPIVSNGQLVGIVSRANLVQAFAAARPTLDIPLSDSTIRDRLLAHLKAQPWAHLALVNITVYDGVVRLWGMVPSQAEKQAMRVAAEQTAGVRSVSDYLIVRPSLLNAA
ncbi:MAG: CBS domain-containing protein [Pseudorhodoplanes sp.]|nr:CBS domain-containing protein [Pseudorhodoplanes sp.]